MPRGSLVDCTVAGGGARAVVDRLVSAVADVDKAATAIAFLGLHPLVDQPERVDVAWDVSKNG